MFCVPASRTDRPTPACWRYSSTPLLLPESAKARKLGTSAKMYREFANPTRSGSSDLIVLEARLKKWSPRAREILSSSWTACRSNRSAGRTACRNGIGADCDIRERPCARIDAIGAQCPLRGPSYGRADPHASTGIGIRSPGSVEVRHQAAVHGVGVILLQPVGTAAQLSTSKVPFCCSTMCSCTSATHGGDPRG